MRNSYSACTTVMTVTLENRRSPRSFTVRWTRLVVVAFVVMVVGVAVVDFTKPERRFRPAETTASVQVRVVRNAAPTVESLQRRILSNDELQDLWDDFFAAAKDGSSTGKREAELVEWRRRLRVEVDSGPIGDLRSIRISWTGPDDIEMGAAIVESLARRYADEVSAERWYGSVDRLRADVRAVETAAKELAAVRQRQASSSGTISDVAPAASFEPVPDERLNAPLLIAPNSDGAVPAAVEKPKPKKIAFPPSPATIAARGSGDPARQLATAAADLRRRMDEMLLPSEAEFPVVTLERIGLSVVHLRPLWYCGVGLLSLLLAGVASVSRVSGTIVTSVPALEGEVQVALPEAAIAPLPPEPDVVPSSIASADEPFAPAAEPEVASDPNFQTAAEVEARLAAPILAVVSRPAKHIVTDAPRPGLRAA